MDETSLPAHGRTILAPAQVDEVAQALLALCREVWVVSDRLYVLERVLERRGLDLREAVDQFQPDAHERAELEALRRRLIDQVLAPLQAGAR
jgi:hypothetical protein